MTENHSCYACDASVLPGASECEACGAQLTERAAERHSLLNEAKSRVDRIKLLAGWGMVATFVFGAVAGSWAAGLSTSDAQTREATEVTERSTPLTRSQVNDIYLRILPDRTGMPFLTWVPAEDGGILVELSQPSPDDPETVRWEALEPEQRRQLMGFLAIMYDAALQEGGYPPQGPDGFTPIELRYRTLPYPLARREADGRLRVYKSPFELAAERRAQEQP